MKPAGSQVQLKLCNVFRQISLAETDTSVMLVFFTTMLGESEPIPRDGDVFTDSQAKNKLLIINLHMFAFRHRNIMFSDPHPSKVPRDHDQCNYMI